MPDTDETNKNPSDVLNIDERTREFLDTRESEIFARYAAVIRRLRASDGCPWDHKQTLHSLRRFLIEESFEVLAAINDHESGNGTCLEIAEELGDVILVTMMIADALTLAHGPTFKEILQENGEKLIRRHPHVFSDVSVRDAAEVKKNWDEIKQTIEQKNSGTGETSPGLPPLERAMEIQKRAARLGFDWPDETPVYDKILEEIEELKAAVRHARQQNESMRDNTPVEAEVGDLLFSAVNLARKLKTDPSVALAGSNERFLKRFKRMEQLLAVGNESVADSSLEKLDELWDQAKRDLT